ncbi:MAG TPA: hypothetical protein VIU81_12030 [Gaiellaceae bacterium]
MHSNEIVRPPGLEDAGPFSYDPLGEQVVTDAGNPVGTLGADPTSSRNIGPGDTDDCE